MARNRWLSQLETSIYNGFSMGMLNNQRVYIPAARIWDINVARGTLHPPGRIAQAQAAHIGGKGRNQAAQAVQIVDGSWKMLDLQVTYIVYPYILHVINIYIYMYICYDIYIITIRVLLLSFILIILLYNHAQSCVHSLLLVDFWVCPRPSHTWSFLGVKLSSLFH